MMYIVYFEVKAGSETVWVLGMFMMKSDAEMFKREHILCDRLVVVETDCWENWTAIRKKAGLY